MYLTYDEYTQLGGSTLEETAFEQLEFEASTIIDWWTFNRLHKQTEYPEAVKRCMYKLISLLQDKQRATAVDPASEGAIKPSVASESNDGVSTSYNTLSAKEAVDTIQKELDKTIQTYLMGVRNSLGHNLLYRGVYPNE